MKIYLTTFSDQKYRRQQKELEEKAIRCGFDGVFSYTKEWLDTTNFYSENKHILDQKRGCGYWLWKPYIILESFKKMDENDMLFYIDCGDMFNDDLIDFIKSVSNKDIIMTPGHPNNHLWCKKDCFVLMDCDNEKYWYGSQIEAGSIIFKKTKHSEEFITEWLKFCSNEHILTDIEPKYDRGQLPFIDHRHDQSILSNLVIKYGITPEYNIHKFLNFNVND